MFIIVKPTKKQLTQRERKGLHGAKSKQRVFQEEVEKLNKDLNMHRVSFSNYLKKMKVLEKRYK